MPQVQVRLVEDSQSPRPASLRTAPAPLWHPRPGRVHAMAKRGQEALQVEHAGGTWPAPWSAVLGPVQAVGHQLDRRRIHQMNHPLESGRRTSPPPSAEPDRIARCSSMPLEQALCHGRRYPLPGWACERVLLRLAVRDPRGQNGPGVQPQGINRHRESRLCVNWAKSSAGRELHGR